jgi:polar amino acid transport system substrate-binding protein
VPHRLATNHRRRVALAVLALATVALLSATGPTGAQSERGLLRGAWTQRDPYQHLDQRFGTEVLTGLDVELARVAFSRADIPVRFDNMAWDEAQRRIRDGTVDFAMGAFRTPERATFARFSEPYRSEDVSLFLRPEAAARFEGLVPKPLWRALAAAGMRIAVLGRASYGPTLDGLIAGPPPSPKLVTVGSIADAVERVLDGAADGVLFDRLAAEHRILADALNGTLVEVAPVLYRGPVHFMFSKVTVSPEQVAAFDAAMRSIREDGTYESIVRSILAPDRIAFALGGDWFLILDAIGTVAFAISGVLLARRQHYSIFGALVLAALPAVGGGVVGDLMAGRRPIGVLETPLPLFLVIATVVVGYLINLAIRHTRGQHLIAFQVALWIVFVKRYVEPGKVFQIFDAIGLASFTVAGVYVAVITRCEPLWLWAPLLATLNAVGGVIIRDVVRADPENPVLKSEFYAEVTIVWGLLLALYLLARGVVADPLEIQAAIMVTMVGTLLTRLAAIVIRAKSPRF